jgi:hypothetical protein
MFISACCCTISLHSQIKVGNNPASINPNSVLEIESTNKGLLLPRLSLSSTTNASPLSSFVSGMFVYNTSTINDVSQGIYYSDGAKWIKVNSSAGTNSWSRSGNGGTLSTNDFLGTTDNAPLILKTNNAEHFRITENGNVGIGTSTPSAALQIKGQLVVDTLQAGNTVTDNVVVANPADGRFKMLPANSLLLGTEKSIEIVATTGQSVFTTPLQITDINKILLYRNGVLISFTINDTNSIISEIPCTQGDEVRIFQFK